MPCLDGAAYRSVHPAKGVVAASKLFDNSECGSVPRPRAGVCADVRTFSALLSKPQGAGSHGQRKLGDTPPSDALCRPAFPATGASSRGCTPWSALGVAILLLRVCAPTSSSHMFAVRGKESSMVFLCYCLDSLACSPCGFPACPPFLLGVCARRRQSCRFYKRLAVGFVPTYPTHFSSFS